jgi:hypothetical protein
LTDNVANIDEAKRLMRVVADERIPRTLSLVDTAMHFSQHYPKKRRTLDDILAALESWTKDTSVIVGTIRKETAARKAGETLYTPRSGAG